MWQRGCGSAERQRGSAPGGRNAGHGGVRVPGRSGVRAHADLTRSPAVSAIAACLSFWLSPWTLPLSSGAARGRARTLRVALPLLPGAASYAHPIARYR